jgi:hypothetical protein
MDNTQNKRPVFSPLAKAKKQSVISNKYSAERKPTASMCESRKSSITPTRPSTDFNSNIQKSGGNCGNKMAFGKPAPVKKPFVALTDFTVTDSVLA